MNGSDINKYQIFGENVIRRLRLEADAAAKDSKELHASGVWSMCQDRNFGSLIQAKRENTCGRFSVSTVVTFTVPQQQDCFKRKPMHTRSLWCIHYVLTQSLWNMVSFTATSSSFPCNCRGKNKKTIYFTEISRNVWIITLSVLLIC